jgi:uncharacterized glyoxalase superfamily protein PhnB
MAITPYLLYRDARAALTWLAAAFGLHETASRIEMRRAGSPTPR